jgi:8-oxo-dGTP pyrophosphatase MutT (NUDIX family)
VPSDDVHTQLIIAAQMGAARELFEETGLDIRDHLYRLEPATLRNEITTNKSGQSVMPCELKKRLYFFLPVTDDDFLSEESVPTGTKLIAPMTE